MAALIYGIYAAIIIVAIALTSCIKLLVKHFTELNTMWEYILSLVSLVLAAGGAFLWLYFYGGFTSWEYLTVMCTLAGTSTYIVYLLIFQSTRKLGLALIAKIFNKTGTSLADAAKTAVEDGNDTSKETAEAATESVQSLLEYLNNKTTTG